MENLIDILESFNRKERFYLLAQALHGHGGIENPRFQISESFRLDLGEAVGLHEQGITIPSDAFVGMDYHLDSIEGSLALTHKDKYQHYNKNRKVIFANLDASVAGTQQDIDLLVAFKAESKYHLVLIEAKGYLSWDTQQLYSKGERLRQIFGENGDTYCDDVEPHFVMMSENQPKIENWHADRQPACWPKWMRNNKGAPLHLTMCLPAKTNKRRVERCDRDGNPAKCEGYFHCPSG